MIENDFKAKKKIVFCQNPFAYFDSFSDFENIANPEVSYSFGVERLKYILAVKESPCRFILIRMRTQIWPSSKKNPSGKKES